MHSSDLLAAISQGIFHRPAHDALRSGDGDWLDGYARVAADDTSALLLAVVDEAKRPLTTLLKLNTGIQILGILTHQHDVHTVIASTGSLDGEGWAQINIQVESLAQSHVHAAESAAYRCSHRTFDSDFVLLDGLDGGVWQRGALGLHQVSASFGDLPFDIHSSSLYYPTHRLCDLGAYTIAGNQRYRVLAQCGLLTLVACLVLLLSAYFCLQRSTI